MIRSCSVAIAFCFAGAVWAQEKAVVVVNTNYPEAVAFVDSLRLGLAQQRTFTTSPGLRAIRLVAPDNVAWSIAPLERTVLLAEGDTTYVTLTFPLHHHIESLPAGAEVYLRQAAAQAFLGITPFTYRTPSVARGRFVVELEGYLAQEIRPTDKVWNRYMVRMQPLHEETGAADASGRVQVRRRLWVDVTAATLLVAGGILSVHHKFKADRLNDEYQDTGNPALRPRVARLDDRAAIALIGMQVGLVTIGVRFYLNR